MLPKIILSVVILSAIFCSASARRDVILFERQTGDGIIDYQTIYSAYNASEVTELQIATFQWENYEKIFTQVVFDLPEDISAHYSYTVGDPDREECKGRFFYLIAMDYSPLLWSNVVLYGIDGQPVPEPVDCNVEESIAATKDEFVKKMKKFGN